MQLVTLFALSNLWMARRHLLAGAGEVRVKHRNQGKSLASGESAPKAGLKKESGRQSVACD